jgi:hypothetical protein
VIAALVVLQIDSVEQTACVEAGTVYSVVSLLADGVD